MKGALDGSATIHISNLTRYEDGTAIFRSQPPRQIRVLLKNEQLCLQPFGPELLEVDRAAPKATGCRYRLGAAGDPGRRYTDDKALVVPIEQSAQPFAVGPYGQRRQQAPCQGEAP